MTVSSTDRSTVRYLSVRETHRKDVDPDYIEVAWRAWHGEHLITIHRSFFRDGFIKISEPQEEAVGDYVLVSIWCLSRGSRQFRTWVHRDDVRDSMTRDTQLAEAS